MSRNRLALSLLALLTLAATAAASQETMTGRTATVAPAPTRPPLPPAKFVPHRINVMAYGLEGERIEIELFPILRPPLTACIGMDVNFGSGPSITVGIDRLRSGHTHVIALPPLALHLAESLTGASAIARLDAQTETTRQGVAGPLFLVSDRLEPGLRERIKSCFNNLDISPPYMTKHGPMDRVVAFDESRDGAALRRQSVDSGLIVDRFTYNAIATLRRSEGQDR
ncbi:MAG: hypothetical protein FJX47_20920 [Alphaproteobacteria bacterium]|nr:hypothetical protein [Alphaproteobacteria bacterium]